MTKRILITIGVTTVIFTGSCCADEVSPYNRNPTTGSSYSKRVCIGEVVCPVGADALYPCGSNFDSIARDSVCAYTDPDGSKKFWRYNVLPQGTHEGNKCGYSWGVITCYPS
jgi:hypothetical protein